MKKQGRQALVDLPEDDPDLIGRGVAIASHFNMYDFNSSAQSEQAHFPEWSMGIISLLQKMGLVCLPQ